MTVDDMTILAGKAHEISKNALRLKLKAERLLLDLRQISEPLPLLTKSKNHGRAVRKFF